MVKFGKHLTKCTAKKPVAKKPKLSTLDDITFKNCEELERYKKLKEHPYFKKLLMKILCDVCVIKKSSLTKPIVSIT
jgi:hypothetical protein